MVDLVKKNQIKYGVIILTYSLLVFGVAKGVGAASIPSKNEEEQVEEVEEISFWKKYENYFWSRILYKIKNYPYLNKTKEFGNSIISYPYKNRTKEFGSSVISYPYKNKSIEFKNFVANHPCTVSFKNFCLLKVEQYKEAFQSVPEDIRNDIIYKSVVNYPYKNRTIEAGNYVWTKVSSIFKSNNSTDKVKTDL